jgi:uncharacterized lipoprotein YmbA
MTLRIALPLGAALLIGAGCASPREHYYTLVAPTPGLNRPAAATTHSVIVERATLPDAEDRPQLVVEAAPQQQAILEQERWIEPLAADLQRAVAARLAASLTDTAVLLAGDHGADPAGRHLYIQVRRFALRPEHGASLAVHWTILGADKATLRAGDFAQDVVAGSRSYAALVQAQSAAVAALADELATQLRGLQ